MRANRYSASVAALLGCFVFILAGSRATAQGCPSSDVPAKFQRYFDHCVDRRSISEKVLNLVGLTNQDVGRSFALIAGIDSYPRLSGSDQSLKPAAADIANLTRYLREVEFFDEIVVLENGAVTDENFKFFFQAYFPERLRAFPKSRFLFAYSGHGFTDGTRGYLVQAQARSLDDKANSISMRLLKVLYDEIVDSAHQSLALINSCYSGDFHPRSFGSVRRLVPKEAGHHVITAGAADQIAWHNERVGPGSIFFEKVFAGLDGRADQYPQQSDGSAGDGVVTVEELDAYLRHEVKFATRQEQGPIRSDLSRHGSKGSFFFLNRDRQLRAGNVGEFDTAQATKMGRMGGTMTRPTRPPPPRGESQLATEVADRENFKGTLGDRKILYELVMTDDKVRFGFDVTNLSDTARAALDEFARRVLIEYPRDIYIEIQGHTDATGSEEYNRDLGLERAESVRKYLNVAHRVPLHRMSVVSFGEAEPIADNNIREGRAKNRRIVLSVLAGEAMEDRR